MAAGDDRRHPADRATRYRPSSIAVALAAQHASHASHVGPKYIAQRRWVTGGTTDGTVKHVWMHKRDHGTAVAPVLLRQNREVIEARLVHGQEQVLSDVAGPARRLPHAPPNRIHHHIA